MGCDPFDRLALALGEVTVNNKYEMSTSDHPVSNGRIFRPRGNQAPALIIHVGAQVVDKKCDDQLDLEDGPFDLGKIC
jgi:hypothetical protein